jgi:hypothetical protein
MTLEEVGLLEKIQYNFYTIAIKKHELLQILS